MISHLAGLAFDFSDAFTGDVPAGALAFGGDFGLGKALLVAEGAEFWSTNILDLCRRHGGTVGEMLLLRRTEGGTICLDCVGC